MAETTPTSDQLVSRITNHLEQLPDRAVLAGSALLAVAIAFVDWSSGPELSLVVFYLMPVLAVSWACSRRTAVLFALTMAATGVTIAVLSPTDYPRDVILWNASVRILFYLLVVALVASQRSLLANVQRQASTDSLTGLANRRVFLETAADELERARRHQRSTAVLFLDVDGLKRVNDELGHEAGDEMIVAVGRALRSHLRPGDLAARVGGDEFVVLLTEAHQDETRSVTARLLDELAQPDPARSAGIGPIRVSVGAWVGIPGPTDDIDHVLGVADGCMYEAKSSRKSPVVHDTGASSTAA